MSTRDTYIFHEFSPSYFNDKLFVWKYSLLKVKLQGKLTETLPLYSYFKKCEPHFPEGGRVKRENIYPWMSGSAAEVSQVRTSPRNSLPRNTTCSPINKIITYNLYLRSHLGAGRFHLQEWNLINEKYSAYLQYKVCVIQNVICLCNYTSDSRLITFLYVVTNQERVTCANNGSKSQK